MMKNKILKLILTNSLIGTSIISSTILTSMNFTNKQNQVNNELPKQTEYHSFPKELKSSEVEKTTATTENFKSNNLDVQFRPHNFPRGKYHYNNSDDFSPSNEFIYGLYSGLNYTINTSNPNDMEKIIDKFCESENIPYYVAGEMKKEWNKFKNLNANNLKNLINLKFNVYSSDSSASFKRGRPIEINSGKWTNYSFSLKYKHINNFDSAKYEKPWNYLGELLEYKDTINLPTDTGGDLNNLDSWIENEKFKHNWEYLDEYVKKLQEKLKEKYGLSLELKYQQLSGNTINLKMNFPYGTGICVSNLKVKFRPSNLFKKLNLEKRLKFALGKWVDFEKHTTELVDDKLVRDPEDTKPLTHTGKEWYGGRWIAHSPLKAIFDTLDDETEVLKVNGKRIDVLDRHFEEELVDNRKDSNDNGSIFDYGVQHDENTQKTKENSHKKNEYKIEITKYKKPGNLDSDIEYTYTKTIVVDSKSSQMKFKWYAWDPAKNPKQKELIEQYLRDEKGNVKKDDNGEPIKNPKYDPAIDPETGTKKQLVWYNFSYFHKTNGYLLNNEGKLEEKQDFSKYYSNEKEKKYYKETKLPYNTKTLFPPDAFLKESYGTIMEASVLGKGALKQLIGKNQNFTLFKLNKQGFFEKIDDKHYKQLATETGESSYFSESGLWMFASNTKGGITNFKLVYIKENSNPHSYLTDNVPEMVGKYITPLWKTQEGVSFKNYLLKKGMTEEDIDNLKYEDAMEHYKSYINALFWGHKYKDYIDITPKFKPHIDNEYTSEEFKNKYFNNIKKFKEDYFDKFEHSNLVDIEEINFGDGNKTSIYVVFKLLTNNAVYRLTKQIQQIEWKFKDITESNRKTIYALPNYEYLTKLAKQTNKSDYLDKLIKHIDKITNYEFDTEKYKDKVKTIVEFDPKNQILEIKYQVKEEFKNDYVISKPESHKIHIIDFLDSEDRFKRIFKNLTLNEINLNGITDFEEARKYVLDKIKKALPNLKLNEDYVINNLDNIIKSRLRPQINSSHPLYSTLILEAKKGIGVYDIKLYNTVSNILENDYDLSQKQLTDKEINENKLSFLKKKIIELINEQFKNENFKVGEDIKIDNFIEGVNFLARGKEATFKFNIFGINSKIKNSTTINIKNLANFVVDDEDPSYKPGDENNPNKAILYDLSLISINDLNFNEYVMSELRNKILQKIEKLLKENYYLINGKDYSINIEELNTLVRKIAQKSKTPLKGTLTLYPINKVSKNKANISIINENKHFKSVDDLEKPIPRPGETEALESAKKAKKRKLMLIFIPLSILGVGLIILLVWLIYIRKIKNKVS